jgi:hypothetical protein
MPDSTIQARQTKYGAFVALYLIVILAVIVAANWLADHHDKSLDVTANKQFTLSDETKKVTGNLKNDVTIYVFDKSENYDRDRDMLDRYRNLSSKIKVDYVDPDKKPDVARVEGARAMGDIIVDNGVKKETAKGLTEEELTGALVRVSKSGAKTACFVTGSGEHELSDTGRDGYSALKSRCRRRTEARLPAAGARCSEDVRAGRRARDLQFRCGFERSGSKVGRNPEARGSGIRVGHHAQWGRRSRPEFGQSRIRADFAGGREI